MHSAEQVMGEGAVFVSAAAAAVASVEVSAVTALVYHVSQRAITLAFVAIICLQRRMLMQRQLVTGAVPVTHSAALPDTMQVHFTVTATATMVIRILVSI